MNDRPTPETDARAWSDHSEGILYEIVQASFARKLERERNEAREKLAKITKAAEAVVDRWEQPVWKDTEPTATVIYRLRDALGREAE